LPLTASKLLTIIRTIAVTLLSLFQVTVLRIKNRYSPDFTTTSGYRGKDLAIVGRRAAAQ